MLLVDLRYYNTLILCRVHCTTKFSEKPIFRRVYKVCGLCDLLLRQEKHMNLMPHSYSTNVATAFPVTFHL